MGWQRSTGGRPTSARWFLPFCSLMRTYAAYFLWLFGFALQDPSQQQAGGALRLRGGMQAVPAATQPTPAGPQTGATPDAGGATAGGSTKIDGLPNSAYLSPHMRTVAETEQVGRGGRRGRLYVGLEMARCADWHPYPHPSMRTRFPPCSSSRRCLLRWRPRCLGGCRASWRRHRSRHVWRSSRQERRCRWVALSV